MNYKYKMEKVLDYRSNVEKHKVEDFARITQKLDQEKKHLDLLEEKLDQKKKEVSTDVNAMKMSFLYKEKLKAELTHQKKKVDDIFHKANDAREVLIEARKDRKIMELLKEKDKDKFQQEMLLKEQKELDDFTIMRFAK
jgi:flagellar FliJ protein